MFIRKPNEENKVIMGLAYALYRQYGFHNGDDFVRWLETEGQSKKRYRLKINKQTKIILLTIAGILCVIAVILFVTMFKKSPGMELSGKGPVGAKNHGACAWPASR